MNKKDIQVIIKSLAYMLEDNTVEVHSICEEIEKTGNCSNQNLFDLCNLLGNMEDILSVFSNLDNLENKKENISIKIEINSGGGNYGK